MVEQAPQKPTLVFDIVPSQAVIQSPIELYDQAPNEDAKAIVLNTQVIQTEVDGTGLVRATEGSVAILRQMVVAGANTQGYLADPIRFLSGKNLVAVAQSIVDEPIPVANDVDQAMKDQLEALAKEAGLQISKTDLPTTDDEEEILADEVFRRMAEDLADPGFGTDERREIIHQFDTQASVRLLLEIRLNRPETLRVIVANIHEFSPQVRNLIRRVVRLGQDNLDLDPEDDS